MWQSDNDDDGNRGCRIVYVMEHGNYGYVDEMTGAGWNQHYLGQPTEIPLRHWHLSDPGVVPNLLQTGAGAPCGISVNEGDLLPKVFHDQIIHADAGPSIVRAIRSPTTAPATRPRSSISSAARGIAGSGRWMCASHRTVRCSWPIGTIRASAGMPSKTPSVAASSASRRRGANTSFRNSTSTRSTARSRR